MYRKALPWALAWAWAFVAHAQASARICDGRTGQGRAAAHFT